MITIATEVCNGCGLCVKICHEHCTDLVENRVIIDHEVCSHCCRCVAVCPAAALEWDGHAPVPFDSRSLPASRQVDELLMQRRTVRFFQKRPVDRSLVDEVVNLGNYAPSHSHTFRVLLTGPGRQHQKRGNYRIFSISRLMDSGVRWSLLICRWRFPSRSRISRQGTEEKKP